MKFDILYNFISPITGRVLSDRDYMLIGDRNNIATPSPLFMDVKIDIQNIQQAIKNIPIEVKGAINLKGKLSSFSLDAPNVLTSTFEPNPVFTGDSLHLPYGPTSTRPISPKEGMFRYNDEIGYIEYFNGADWAYLTSDIKPLKISEDFAANLTFGAITNANCGFDGFVSGEKDVNIKIKSSYYIEDEGSSSSLLLLNRYNNGYIFSNKTDTNWNNSFSFNRINNELKTELFKYDGLSNKFIFNKPIEVPYPTNNNDATNKAYVDSLSGGVQDVLGTAGQILSSGGQYPQIGLIESGVSSGTYKLANVTYDVFGRAVSASDGQAVTSITAGSGLTGGTITDIGEISISPTGVTAGTYKNTNLEINSEGRIVSVSESNTIGRITFYGNNIATSVFNEDLVIDPNYAGGSGDVYINSNTSLQNGSYLRLYDNSNTKYTEIRSPNFYSQPSTLILPTTPGQQDQFIKMGANNQLEWTTIIVDPGVTRVDSGFGLYGGPITDIGTLSVKTSDFLGSFQFNGNTIKASTSGINLDASGGTITAYDSFDFEEAASFRYGSQPLVTFSGRGYVYVGSDGKLRYQNTQGTYIIAG